MTRPQRRAVTVLAVLAALAATAVTGARIATASPPPAPCPPGMTCITGKLTIRDPGSDTPHQLLILDKAGAPMFWVDYGGAGSGGEPFCVYSLTLRPLACLGGGQGSYGGQAVVVLYANGRAFTLTARDIVRLHLLERNPR